MKAGQFTNFKRGLLSPDAQTRNAFQHLGYAFFGADRPTSGKFTQGIITERIL